MSALTVAALHVAQGRRTVVADVSFTLQQGQVVALVGPNGAGKTTLLKALAGLLPASGHIDVLGTKLAALTAASRAKKMAYLPQGNVVHWPLQVRDVVALGRFAHGLRDPSRLPAADRAIVARAMAATGIEALADRNVQHLSGGERSRVALARALAVEAPILLADEPTASLDPRHQIEAMAILRRRADEGGLVLVVTHDLGLAARFADGVLVLDGGGRLAAWAPPSAALGKDVLEGVFGVAAYRAAHADAPVLVPWSVT